MSELSSKADLRDRLIAAEELLAAIYLHVPWSYIRSQLTGKQRALWADVVDTDRARRRVKDPTVEPGTVSRWWDKDGDRG